MSSFTNFLNLFKWDPQSDAEEEFDIESALNENWEKIDTGLEECISDIEDKILFSDNVISVSSKITANTNYTIPISYIVGANEIEIYWNGIYLAKDENWEEIGTEGQASTTVKFGWDIEVGEELLIRKRGVSND